MPWKREEISGLGLRSTWMRCTVPGIFTNMFFQVDRFIDLSKKTYQMLAFEWDDQAEGAGGALVKMDFNQPSRNGSIIYFNCEDCAEVEKRAKEKGAEIIVPKTSLEQFGFSAIIRDSEGNLIGLYSLH